ncbi:MAG: ABC transporter permease, partial [Actinobacteria bacterium]|nr:ABC transporter permease [Actinomycetota bacterium]
MWVSFALRRAVRLLVSVWVLVTFSFLIIHLTPGDPVRAALGAQAPASVVADRRAELRLDDPFLSQYAGYLRDLLRGDLGTSFQSRLPVSEVIGDRLP